MVGQHTQAHSGWIAHILETRPGAKTAGFWGEHERLCLRLGAEPFKKPFRPDAFRFNEETTEIEIYEVEVQSPLSRAKVQLLAELWAAWDGEEHDWEPVLFLVDRYGNINRMDLRHAEYGTGWAAML